jgi:hypothetical protein
VSRGVFFHSFLLFLSLTADRRIDRSWCRLQDFVVVVSESCVLSPVNVNSTRSRRMTYVPVRTYKTSVQDHPNETKTTLPNIRVMDDRRERSAFLLSVRENGSEQAQHPSSLTCSVVTAA